MHSQKSGAMNSRLDFNVYHHSHHHYQYQYHYPHQRQQQRQITGNREKKHRPRTFDKLQSKSKEMIQEGTFSRSPKQEKLAPTSKMNEVQGEYKVALIAKKEQKK